MPLRVLVQCKALKTKVGPNMIRELEGAFVGAPVGWRVMDMRGGVFAVMVSTREATKGVREAMGRSKWPMVWVMLEIKQKRDDLDGIAQEEVGRVRQVLWNKVAAEMGLEGLTVTVKYEGAPNGTEQEMGKECVLMWSGKPVPGLEESEACKDPKIDQLG